MHHEQTSEFHSFLDKIEMQIHLSFCLHRVIGKKGSKDAIARYAFYGKSM